MKTTTKFSLILPLIHWPPVSLSLSLSLSVSLYFSVSLPVCLPQIKTGAPCRSERLAKYNQLMRWELPVTFTFKQPLIYKVNATSLLSLRVYRGIKTQSRQIWPLTSVTSVTCDLCDLCDLWPLWPLTCRIEEELGDKAKFAGKSFRHPKIN